MRRYKRQILPEDTEKYTLANLNLREEKSTTAKVLTVIPAGSKVQVVDAAEDWYEVIYNGIKGYVYNEYLSKTEYTWTDTVLRPFADSATTPIENVPVKSRVQVLGTVGDWSHVIYNDKEGYIFSVFLSNDGKQPGEYNFEYFYTDMARFVNDNNIKKPYY
ncbi:MAG: SH3 domain-containing protein [Terrisporobacter sp.]